ncbi:hypothetical protein ACP70R_002824 [Stipagrostis hirtigluma subsp. patula]
MAAGKGEDLKLLGLDESPFAARVRMALSVKGVGYEYIVQDLFNKSELLLRSNPVHKKVPVLIHNGNTICESLVIVQYVDEVWAGMGTSILPADPYKRAVARFWAAFIDDKLFPAWVGIMRAATEEERAEKVKETFAAIEHLEKAFVECSNGKAFFGGDSVGYVDLALGCFLFWFGAVHKMFGVEIIDASKSPLLAAWAGRFGETSAAAEVLPEPDKAVEYAMKLRAKRAAAK